ncbi:Phosphodiest-domain-containing protein [Piedraia hortae CBS 480.64]|uniref:Phosphodiest-domain-containing protein n=1 Tax=Piedraia hortae CBS 480.64 TaxID=1314780 RepID=A0A6A7C1W2_9PEZI|nr:Phosphodiest-domain-containing protein [Piedraia hortae CBS 480.64]
MDDYGHTFYQSRSRRSRYSLRNLRPRSFLIFVFILGLIYYIVRLHAAQPVRKTQPTRTNGTHEFLPTTILISLDGFRPDFLQRNITPALLSLASQGLSPPHMRPSFPTLTFPNHYTLVTGRYPSNHGIVANSFWDPDEGDFFSHYDPIRRLQVRWWNGAEPLWATAHRQGLHAAVHMWPGSDVTGGIRGWEPAIVDKYKAREPLDRKAKRLLSWLDQAARSDAAIRPQFIAGYVPDVDSASHRYGPDSAEANTAVARVDGMINDVLLGIEARNLTDIVNLVVVSDHGMAAVEPSRFVILDDLIDMDLIHRRDAWPLGGIWPKDNNFLTELYNQLLARKSLARYKDKFDIYLREDIPKKYNFKNHGRIAPLWIIPRVGYALLTRDELELSTTGLRGLHGYDNFDPLMRAIFMARGPAFASLSGSHLEPFQNVEVYNLICHSLGLIPAANDGRLVSELGLR